MHKTIIRRSLEDGDCQLPETLHPVLRQIYAARAIRSEKELDHSLTGLHPAALLSGLDEALELMVDVLHSQSRILIVGDFDADGATSCALAMRMLPQFGYQHVDYLVPNRFKFGYGLTPEIVEIALQREPDLIITVDNGISSLQGVAAANANGIAVLVTDHHLPGDTLPDAAAILNPNKRGDPFPSKNLAGVGVMFYLLMALRAHLREQNWFAEAQRKEPNLADALDLVALGTVADVVPLDHNNRILVEQGLRRIRAGHCCAGIHALLALGKRNPAQLVASDLGFAVGPRLNAAGRLDDMSLGIECLLATTPERANELAQKLDELNLERRRIEQEMQTDAERDLDALELTDETLPLGLCLFRENWHPGVVGILASRIKDRFHRPVLVFAPDGDDVIKGSGRSIPGLHIRDALDAIATRHPDLISHFGGHAMAAGLSIAREHFDAFRHAFEEELARHLSEESLQNVVHSDGELSANDLNLGFAELLRTAGPWGQAFPEPVFDGVFDIDQRRIVGEHHLKLVLRDPDTGQLIDGIAFNQTDADWADNVRSLRVAFRLDVNEYRDKRSPQLMIEYLEPV
jgi:single-stranded-DNA-specific exonuclease